MEEIHKTTLRKCQTLIVDQLNPETEFWDFLVKDSHDINTCLFTPQMLQDIEAEKTVTTKVRQLMKLLVRRGPDAYTKFLSILENTGYRDLAIQIKKQEMELDGTQKDSNELQKNNVAASESDVKFNATDCAEHYPTCHKCKLRLLQSPYNVAKQNNVDSASSLPESTPMNAFSGSKQSNDSMFIKSIDDSTSAQVYVAIAKSTESVGIIKGKCVMGSGFRIGTKYIMTANHVIAEILAQPVTAGKTAEDNLSESFIVFSYMDHISTNAKKFNFTPMVIYSKEELDIAILELQVGSNELLPPALRTFGTLDDGRPIYLIGHPDGKPMFVDPIIDIIKENEVDNLYQMAKSWSLNWKQIDGYAGISDKRRAIFHSCFMGGASGCPGVMINGHECVLVLVYLKGFPDFFYKKGFLTEQEMKGIPDNYRIEQGVKITEVLDDIRLQNCDLFRDIIGN